MEEGSILLNSTKATATKTYNSNGYVSLLAASPPLATSSDVQTREALEKMDNEKFGWFHVKAVATSGVGFFADAYDLFIVNIVVPMIGFVYFSWNNNQVPSVYDGIIKGSCTLGTLIGQLLFGFLGDTIGRKKMYGIELMIMIVSTVGCALAGSMVRGLDIVAILSFWRFFLGIGIGGDYPMSAVITSEFAPKNHRGQMIAAVFSMQGMGILVGALVGVTVLACFRPLIEADQYNLDYVWRICILIGVVPAVFGLYFRLTIPETPRFTLMHSPHSQQAIKDANLVIAQNRGEKFDASAVSKSGSAQAVSHSERLKEFRNYFSKWENLKVLLGCSISWFALDVAFYGVNLNQTLVLQAIGFGGANKSPYDQMFSLALGNLIISLMGTVPGYFITVATIERLGRKGIQIMGFIMLTVLFVFMAAAYQTLVANAVAAFVVLITLAQFFFNFGPNVTTFVVPGEVFPTRFRSFGHGISAASGKLGAIIATYGFAPLKDVGGKNASMPLVLGIFSVFMAIGLVSTFWIPETKGKSLEELSNETEVTLVDDIEMSTSNATTTSDSSDLLNNINI